MIKKLAFLFVSIILLTGCSSAGVKYSPENIRAATHSAIEDYSIDVAAEIVEPFAEPLTESAPLVSAVFSQDMQIQTAENGAKLFSNQLCVPTFHTDDADLDSWIAGEMKQISLEVHAVSDAVSAQAAADYQSSENAADFYPYSYHADLQVKRMDAQAISVLRNDSTYNGGNDAVNVQISYNYSLVNREKLSIFQVIYREKVAFLQELLLSQISDRLEKMGSPVSPTDYQTVVQTELLENWYFNDRGLVFFVPSQHLSPNLSGTIQIELTYEALQDILRPEFVPITNTGAEGVLVLQAQTDGQEILFASDGKSPIYLTAVGVVYNVRISQLNSWIADDLPMAGRAFFSASRISGMEAVCLSADQKYVVTFQTASGETYMYAISAMRLIPVQRPENG